MNNSIDITAILGQELKSRSYVSDFALYIKNLNMKDVKVDFSKVTYATRSFIDEYYNIFIKNHNTLENNIHVENINISSDIQAIFNAVSNTQNGENKKRSSQNASVVSFTNFSNSFLKSSICPQVFIFGQK
jgi:hypothetical protein